MGHPQKNVEGYKQANVLTWAKRLQVPLLLIHGTADDNVYLTHTLKASKAYFEAGKVHAVLPISGATHHVRGKKATRRLWERIASFLFETLYP